MGGGVRVGLVDARAVDADQTQSGLRGQALGGVARDVRIVRVGAVAASGSRASTAPQNR